MEIFWMLYGCVLLGTKDYDKLPNEFEFVYDCHEPEINKNNKI